MSHFVAQIPIMDTILMGYWVARLYFLEKFRSNSLYSVTFLSNPEELSYPIPQEKGKGTPEECVSIIAISDLHTYFLRRSVINNFFLLKNNNHATTSTEDTRFLFVLGPPRQGGWGADGRGGVVQEWEGVQLFGHTLLDLSLHIVSPLFA